MIPRDAVARPKSPPAVDDPSDAEILESLRIGMLEALRGEGRPAYEVLDEIDRE